MYHGGQPAEQRPGGRRQSLRRRGGLPHPRRSGLLSISCDNSYDGILNTDEAGQLRSTKPAPAAHHFGLSQMRAVSKKHHSILDISYTEDRFTIQTALKL